MRGKLVHVLDEIALKKLLSADTPVEKIVENLYKMGNELAKTVKNRRYKSLAEFKKAQQEDQTELVELEGPATLDDKDIVILRGCPIADEIIKLYVNGKPPAFQRTIMEDYMAQNPGSNALLHPGCIAHQVARQLIIKDIEIDGKRFLNFYQLACRSTKTGFIVYDENGLKHAGMTKAQASKLIEGCACLYVITRQH